MLSGGFISSSHLDDVSEHTPTSWQYGFLNETNGAASTVVAAAAAGIFHFVLVITQLLSVITLVLIRSATFG